MKTYRNFTSFTWSILETIKNPDEYLEDLVQLIPETLFTLRITSPPGSGFEDAKADLEDAKEHLIKIASGKKSKIGDLLVYPIEKAEVSAMLKL
jgi:hypothetical protein